MASSVSVAQIYTRNQVNLYSVVPTVTGEYIVHGSSPLLDLQGFKSIGATFAKTGTQTNSMVVGIGVSTASAASNYTLVKTASTVGVALATTSIEVDVDELAALGSGYRYAAVFVSAATTHAGNLGSVAVIRAFPKRAYSGLTAAQTASTAAVTGSTI